MSFKQMFKKLNEELIKVKKSWFINANQTWRIVSLQFNALKHNFEELVSIELGIIEN